MKKIHAVLFSLVFSSLTPALLAQDFGDHSSATLTGKAWEEYGRENFEMAMAYINRCKELYLKTAKEQQASLSDFAPAEKAHDYWALNDVGTSLFIEGQLLEKQGKIKEALEAYKVLVFELGFAQTWDPKGWFWRPAEAAAARVKQLEFDALLD
ncbi:MAG: beta-glucanase precursor [Verrucomicrobia bacterium]|nr:beta-glucanase precursor [Verrucomicrobiota bacterium]MCH8526284.1 beta-glucanase precursor [Kiritimatiellia bacterium]